MEKGQEWEDKSGKTEHSIKDTGPMMLLTAKADSSKQEEMSTKDNGSMIRLKEKVYIFTKTALLTPENGLMTSNTVMVTRNGQMGLSIKEITLKV